MRLRKGLLPVARYCRNVEESWMSGTFAGAGLALVCSQIQWPPFMPSTSSAARLPGCLIKHL